MKQKRIIASLRVSRYKEIAVGNRVFKEIQKKITDARFFLGRRRKSAPRHADWKHPYSSETSGRFPSRPVTLFAPDDYYLGTRKFMDLLTVPRT